MSDQIYVTESRLSSDNFVTVAQACHGVLTKIHHADRETTAYAHVKHFNFFEERIDDLHAMFRLSTKLLDKSRCCILRCRIKDMARRRYVVRTVKDGENGPGTLVPHTCNWFAIDIDDYAVSFGDLTTDARAVLLALPSAFHDVECFAVATASYGLKPGIRLRLFFWAQEPVTNRDLNRLFRNNRVNADLAIYSNPVQPIYTAKPIFDGLDDPVKERIVWLSGSFSSVNVPVEYVHVPGFPEMIYTKREAIAHANKYLFNISQLSQGERHPGLIKWCYPLGKLVGQGHFEREDMIARIYDYTSFWLGKRDPKKDMATIIGIVDRGIASMMENGND